MKIFISGTLIAKGKLMRSLIDLFDFVICVAILLLIALFPVSIRPLAVIIHYRIASLIDNMTCPAKARLIKLNPCLSTLFMLSLLQSLAQQSELRPILVLLFIFSAHIACASAYSAVPLSLVVAEYALFTIPLSLLAQTIVVQCYFLVLSFYAILG